MSSSPVKQRPFKSPNKIIGHREDINFFKNHYRRIENIDKGFDDAAPPRLNFSYQNKHWKEISQETEKQGFENLHLLTRLQRVFDYSREEDVPLQYRSSLQTIPGLKMDRYTYPRIDCQNLRMTPLESQSRARDFQRTTQLRDIMSENTLLMDKLASTRSNYERNSMEKSFKKSREYLANARKTAGGPSPAKLRLQSLHDGYLTARGQLQLGSTGLLEPLAGGTTLRKGARSRSSSSRSAAAGTWDTSTQATRDARLQPWFKPGDPASAREVVTSLYGRTNGGLVTAREAPGGAASSSSGRAGAMGGRRLYGPESYVGAGTESLLNDRERIVRDQYPPPGAIGSPRRGGGAGYIGGAPISPSESWHHRVPVLAGSQPRARGASSGAAAASSSSGVRPGKGRPESRSSNAANDVAARDTEVEGGISEERYSRPGLEAADKGPSPVSAPFSDDAEAKYENEYEAEVSAAEPEPATAQGREPLKAEEEEGAAAASPSVPIADDAEAKYEDEYEAEVSAAEPEPEPAQQLEPSKATEKEEEGAAAASPSAPIADDTEANYEDEYEAETNAAEPEPEPAQELEPSKVSEVLAAEPEYESASETELEAEPKAKESVLDAAPEVAVPEPGAEAPEAEAEIEIGGGVQAAEQESLREDEVPAPMEEAVE